MCHQASSDRENGGKLSPTLQIFPKLLSLISSPAVFWSSELEKTYFCNLIFRTRDIRSLSLLLQTTTTEILFSGDSCRITFGTTARKFVGSYSTCCGSRGWKKRNFTYTIQSSLQIPVGRRLFLHVFTFILRQLPPHLLRSQSCF